MIPKLTVDILIMETESTKPYSKKKFYAKYKNLDRASYDLSLIHI